MKILKITVLIIGLLLIVSCSTKPNTDYSKIFPFIWESYIAREFEESFHEKLSISQRSQILVEITGKYAINYAEIKEYMKQNEMEKYKRVFMEK